MGLPLAVSLASKDEGVFPLAAAMGISTGAGIPVAGKWVLMFCMLLGRLEIYTLLVLLVPEFWRR